MNWVKWELPRAFVRKSEKMARRNKEKFVGNVRSETKVRRDFDPLLKLHKSTFDTLTINQRTLLRRSVCSVSAVCVTREHIYRRAGLLVDFVSSRANASSSRRIGRSCDCSGGVQYMSICLRSDSDAQIAAVPE